MSTVGGDEANGGSTNAENDEKVVFLLRAVGGAPILKKKKWALPRFQTIAFITEFLKKHLQLPADEQLLLYVNQAFAPAIDTTIGAIKDCFHSEGTLVLHYTRTPAWG